MKSKTYTGEFGEYVGGDGIIDGVLGMGGDPLFISSSFIFSYSIALNFGLGNVGNVGNVGDEGDVGDVGDVGDEGDEGDVGDKGDVGDVVDVDDVDDVGDEGDEGGAIDSLLVVGDNGLLVVGRNDLLVVDGFLGE